MPRVSVIVPAHDSGAVLEATLASVLAQTYGDWEVVVADDASADDSAQRARDVLGERGTVVRTERNLGPAGARNLALEHATGELVAFLDADDLWLPAYLERQVARYDEERRRPGPPVGIVACDAQILEGGAPLAHTYLEQFPWPVEDLSLDRVLRRNCVYVSALVPRAAGDRVGWFSTELFGTEDHDLWIRILEQGYRAVLNREVLAAYRHTPGSVSSDVARMGRNNQRTYERALERGLLGRAQRRIARRELRYNRAMEAVAAARFSSDRAGLARRAPLLAWVVLTRPRLWGDWWRALRSA